MLHLTICVIWSILLILVILAVLVPEWTRSVVSPRFDLKSIKPIFVIAVAGLTLLLALVGHFEAPDPANSETRHLVASAYKTAQIILLNADSDGGNKWIDLARLGAIASLVLLAAATLQVVFADAFQRLRLWRASGHVVICGLGRVGAVLLRDLLQPKMVNGVLTPAKMRASQVVVVERDRQNLNLDIAHELGAVIIHGDGKDEQVLHRINATAAKSVFFVTGSDENNIEGALDLSTLVTETKKGHKSSRTPPDMFVHLTHGSLGNLLGHVPSAIPFNVIRRSALDLITSQILPYRPRQPDEVAHFVVVGFGPMGQEVVRLLAELGHFENRKRSRITVVHSPAETLAVQQFQQQFPRAFPPSAHNIESADSLRFKPEAEQKQFWTRDPAMDDWSYGVHVGNSEDIAPGDVGIEFVANGCFVTDAAAPMSSFFINGLMHIASQPRVRPMVVLCSEIEEQNCILGRALRDEIDQRSPRGDAKSASIQPIPIFAFVPRKPKLSKLAGTSGLIMFGACSEVCAYDALTLDISRPLAKLLALKYDVQSGKTTSLPFHEKLSWVQYSNLSAAAHLQVKLAKVGWVIVTYTDPRSAIPNLQLDLADIPVVAEMEHNRWSAERLMMGWTFGRDDDAMKRRHQLVPWDQLSPEQRKKDEEQIITTMEFLRANLANASVAGKLLKAVATDAATPLP